MCLTVPVCWSGSCQHQWQFEAKPLANVGGQGLSSGRLPTGPKLSPVVEVDRQGQSLLDIINEIGSVFNNNDITCCWSSRPELQMNEMAWFEIGRSSTACYVGIVRQMTTGKLGQKGHLADGSGQVMCSAKSIEQIHHSPLAHRQRSMSALFRKFSLSRKNLGGWQNARGRHLLVVFNGPCLLVW